MSALSIALHTWPGRSRARLGTCVSATSTKCVVIAPVNRHARFDTTVGPVARRRVPALVPQPSRWNRTGASLVHNGEMAESEYLDSRSTRTSGPPRRSASRWTARRHLPRKRKIAAGLALAVAALTTAGLMGFFSDDPHWPTGCGVDGHPGWCTDPSQAMTDPAMTELVGSYCPGLARADPGELAPQPLSRIDIAGGSSLARTTGRPDRGTEDALIGVRGAGAWLTRAVGGPEDGRIQVRCQGSRGRVPGLVLEASQVESTLAAIRGKDRVIDFGQVARRTAASLWIQRASDASFGYFTCDTSGIDLRRPRAASTFTCMTEIYAAEGKGGHVSTYTVSAFM